MKGDFSRNTFDPEKHFTRVLMQQGRVQMDADWNEQLEIDAHQAATEAIDVIGSAGAPEHAAAFGVVLDPTSLSPEMLGRLKPGLTSLKPGDFLLTPGRFYAAGTLCEVQDYCSLTSQPDFPGARPIDKEGRYLVYLDVWQRHLTALDDEGIREKALGGPDTATRAETIWQVRTLRLSELKPFPPKPLPSDSLPSKPLPREPFPPDPIAQPCHLGPDDWARILKLSTGRLAARAQTSAQDDAPCALPPGAGYRRLENQLYRVEIDHPGKLGEATFKWSRDNGTVVTRLIGSDGGKGVTVSDLGRDQDLGFHPGDWVELLDDANELNGTPGVLAQIERVERGSRKVYFKDAPAPFDYGGMHNPKMRRWDDPGGARTVEVPRGRTQGWLELEDGVQVRFAEGFYNTGDYWLIPARTAPNGVEWPVDSAQEPSSRPCQGITHTYCCLGYVTATLSQNPPNVIERPIPAGGTRPDGRVGWADNSNIRPEVILTDWTDCRELFPPLTELADEKEARRRHNRFLHGWGVVCGLQVHCGPDRERVRVKPGYALECDGSELLLSRAVDFPVVASAVRAGLLADEEKGTGKVVLTATSGEAGQPCIGLRGPAGEKPSGWKAAWQGTMLPDLYRDCIDPVVQLVRDELFIDDKTDKRLVDISVRRRTAAVNLAAQFVNRTAAGHVLLSEAEHTLLDQLCQDVLNTLSDPVFCGLKDGIVPIPDYPFRKQGVRTAFGKAAMTQVRVSPDGRLACAFGGAADAKIHIFDLGTAELVAEIVPKQIPGVNTPVIRDLAFHAEGSRILVAATAGGDSILYSYDVPKDGGHFEMVEDPVRKTGLLVVKLGQIAPQERLMVAIVQRQGLVRFDPALLASDPFTPLLRFNATGQWALGSGTGAGLIYAGAADETVHAPTDRYTKVLLLDVREEKIADSPFDLLGGSGTDGFGVLFRALTEPLIAVHPKASRLAYVVVDEVDSSNRVAAKKLLIFDQRGQKLREIELRTTGPVSLAPAPGNGHMLVTLAEEYLLGWIGPDDKAWPAERTLPTQMFPMGLATATPSSNDGGRASVLVVNRDSHTISIFPEELISPHPQLTVEAMVEYRLDLVACYRDLGLRLLQNIKDCCCEHLRVDCPDCGEDDVLELATVDIREGRVFHICHACRRELITFPKVGYWLSAIPVIPMLSQLVREFCCTLLPEGFPPAEKPSSDLVQVALLGWLRGQVTAPGLGLVKTNLVTRAAQLAAQFKTAARIQALAPFRPEVALRAPQLLNGEVDAVKQRLDATGVVVSTVAEYDTAAAETAWQNLLNLQFDFKPGDRVNLLVKDGKVVMITRAKVVARAGGAPEPEAEIERLSAKLAELQASHAAYVAASEKQMAEVQASLRGFASSLNAHLGPPAAPPAAKSPTEDAGGDQPPE